MRRTTVSQLGNSVPTVSTHGTTIFDTITVIHPLFNSPRLSRIRKIRTTVNAFVRGLRIDNGDVGALSCDKRNSADAEGNISISHPCRFGTEIGKRSIRYRFAD